MQKNEFKNSRMWRKLKLLLGNPVFNSGWCVVFGVIFASSQILGQEETIQERDKQPNAGSLAAQVTKSGNEAEQTKFKNLETATVKLYEQKRIAAFNETSVAELSEAVDKHTELLGTMDFMRHTTEFNRLNSLLETEIHKVIWASINETDRKNFAQFLTFVPMQAGATEYLRNRPDVQIPDGWSECRGNGWRLSAPPGFAITKDSDGAVTYQCNVDGFTFLLVASDLATAGFGGQQASAKHIAEQLSRDRAGFSAACYVNGKTGHGAEYRQLRPFPGRVSVRVVQHENLVLLLCCIRKLENTSTRIPNAFFDSVKFTE